jgi:hypothetical protein
MPTLVDGRDVAPDSEEWRAECEARAMAKLPTLAERRAWLGDVERKRGKEAADRLRSLMLTVWDRR